MPEFWNRVCIQCDSKLFLQPFFATNTCWAACSKCREIHVIVNKCPLPNCDYKVECLSKPIAQPEPFYFWKDVAR
jgi:hypothetical protein